MKLLLYSNYWSMPNDDIIKLLGKRGGCCLFCDYADRRAFNYIENVKKHLSEVFDKIVDLSAGYKFKDEIDCIFINGGNNFELAYKLKKNNQFDIIRQMILSGVLYVGDSAGSMLLGDDFSFSLAYEKPERSLDIEEFSKGFGIIHKNIVVHASRYTLSYRKGFYVSSSWKTYLKYKKDLPNALKIPNNGVFVVNGDKSILKTYPYKTLIKLAKNR